MNDKIMAAGNLEDIVSRLTCCNALLFTVHMNMTDGHICNALGGVCDLLESICRDFRADIEAAEDYEPGKETAT